MAAGPTTVKRAAGGWPGDRPRTSDGPGITPGPVSLLGAIP
jgi:hypothetical protein